MTDPGEQQAEDDLTRKAEEDQASDAEAEPPAEKSL